MSYQAVLGVISDGLSISQTASKVGVSRQTLNAWLARYEESFNRAIRDGLENVA
jgi:transposase-like protein